MENQLLNMYFPPAADLLYVISTAKLINPILLNTLLVRFCLVAIFNARNFYLLIKLICTHTHKSCMDFDLKVPDT